MDICGSEAFVATTEKLTGRDLRRGRSVRPLKHLPQKNGIMSARNPSREGEEMSSPKIGIFWPGDYRSKPNELDQPNAEEATVQLERALKKLGRTSYRIEGFLSLWMILELEWS